MSDLSSFPATSTAGSAKTGPTTNNTNIGILAVHFADSSDPSSPSNGYIWWRTDGTTRYVCHAYINGSKVTLFGATDSGGLILEQALDCDGNELKNALCEKLATGSLPAAGASTEGETPYDTTLDRFAYITASDQFYSAMCNVDGSTYVEIPCDINDTNIGTPGTANTDTIFGGFQLDAAAEASGITGEQLLERLGRAYFHTSRGTIDEMEAWLQSQNVDTSEINLEEFYGNLERSRGIQRRFQGLGVRNRQELAQMFGEPAREAQRAHETRIRAATAGQALLSDINAEMRGGALDRMVGAISEGATSLTDVTMAAFGFAPTDEIQAAVGEKWVKEMSELHKELSNIQDDPTKQGRVSEIKQRMRELTTAASEFAPGGALAGIDRTKGTKMILDTLDRDVQEAARTMADDTADRASRLQSAQVVSDALQKLETTGAYDAVLSQLSGREREDFQFMVDILSTEQYSVQSQLDRARDTSLSGEDRRLAEEKVLGDVSQSLGYGVDALRGRGGEIHRRIKRRARGARRTLRNKAQLVNEMIEARRKFMSATGEERAELAAQLGEIGYDIYESGLVSIDEDTGELVPDEQFIRHMVLLSRDVYGKGEEAARRGDQLRDSLVAAFGDSQYAADSATYGDLSADSLDLMQKRMRETGTLDPLDLDALDVKKRLSLFQRMELEAGGIVRGQDAKPEVKAWQQLTRLRRVLSARSPTGDLSGLQIRAIGRLVSSLAESQVLFDERGLLREDAVDLIKARWTDPRTGEFTDPDAMISTMMALEEVGALKGDDKDILKFVKESFEVEKTMEEADKKSSTPGTRTEDEDIAGSFRLVDGDTGETLKIVEVRRLPYEEGKGRDAARIQSRRRGRGGGASW